MTPGNMIIGFLIFSEIGMYALFTLVLQIHYIRFIERVFKVNARITPRSVNFVRENKSAGLANIFYTITYYGGMVAALFLWGFLVIKLAEASGIEISSN